MRLCLIIGMIILATGAPREGSAQSARLGRLPVLSLPAADISRCASNVPSAELLQLGIGRILNVKDTANNRLLSLGLDQTGAPRILIALMSTHEGHRGESEMVTAFFTGSSAVIRGSRSAQTSGTPSRQSEDRRSGLLPQDTGQIKALAVALRRICRV